MHISSVSEILLVLTWIEMNSKTGDYTALPGELQSFFFTKHSKECGLKFKHAIYVFYKNEGKIFK